MPRLAATFLLAALSVFPVVAADRVACYYGAGRIDELACYDLVILQPGRYAASDIQRLKAAGNVTVLGYVSLGEDDHLRRGNGKGPGGQASWYTDQFTGPGFATIGADNVPDSNPNWNSYYVDPSDRRWRAEVKNQVRRIRELGMDGVFADTVLLPDDKFTDVVEARMRKGMTRLVRSLKGWAGGGTVFVNNGYDHLDEWAGNIDGLMIESTVEPGGYFWEDIRRIAADVAPYRRRLSLRLVTLFYVNSAAEIPEACAALDRLGLPGSLYVRDADGLALNTLPDATCPR